MRKLFGLVVAAVVMIGVSAPANAGSLLVSGSTMNLAIGALPPPIIAQAPDPVTIVTSGGAIPVPAGLFTTTFIPSKALFTGVSQISSLSLTIANGAGSMAAGGGQAGNFGGSAPLQGQSIVGIIGGVINLIIPLSVAGASGNLTTNVASFGLVITVTGDAWTTGTAKITKVTTDTPNGGVTNTVTLTGSDNRTVNGVGTVTLVTPTRVLTSAAGNLPAPAIMVLKFVPEPGAALMLISAVAGLAALGYRRKRQ